MSSYIYQLVIDFIVFKLVDSFAKSAILDAKNDSEKKKIWFYESGFLAAVSLPIYLLDHTPYLLWLLTGCTFLFTQLLGQLHLLYWWNLLKTRWDEYLQHQESLERLQNSTAAPASSMSSTPVSSSAAVTNPVPGVGQPFSSYQMVPQPPSVSNYDHLLSNTPAVISQQYGHKSVNDLDSQHAAYLASHYPHNNVFPSQKTLPRRTSGNPSVYFPENVTVCADNTITQPIVRTFWPHNVLRRRPLRPSAIRNAPTFPLYSDPQNDPLKPRETPFKERLLSVFGFTTKNPPGLENDGQNVCFMNCILQCLARTPFLVSRLLAVNIEHIPCTSVEERQFLSEFVTILTKCSAESQARMSVLDTEPLKMASQLMKCSLLNEHAQQDAAEFLMWLLTTTHNILNKVSLNEEPGQRKEVNAKVAALKSVYGEMGLAQIQKLQYVCKQQIEKTNSLDTECYAELAQRLSDLDWLSYKQENSSIIDDLYTGQLLEAYNCSWKGHLSIQTQTFAVLPVPIGELTISSADVYLEDCFTVFSSVEQLSGQVCSLCTKTKPTEYPPSGIISPGMSPPSLSYVPPHVNIQTPSAFPMGSFMSPIVRDDLEDSYQSIGIRTSTPRYCAGPCDGIVRDKQDIERRCLLHQLPECLIIQLLRFTFDSRTKKAKKIMTPVNITLIGLDLGDIVFDLGTTNRGNRDSVELSCKYDLYGVCVHLSSRGTSSGHYICYCLDSNDKWYKFDDDNVTEVDMQYELLTRTLTENAYLLFYKRA